MSCLIDTGNINLINNIDVDDLFMKSYIDLDSVFIVNNTVTESLSMHDYINVGIINLCNFVSVAVLSLGVNIDTQSLYTCFTVVSVNTFTWYPVQWFNSYFNEGFK